MATSVLEIDIKDEKFKDFLKAFEAYRKHLGDMPDGWKAVGASASKAAGDANKILGEQEKHASHIVNYLNLQVRSQSELGRVTKNTNTAFKDLARTTGQVFENVAKTTFQLLKWAALGGLAGVATGGLGFGLLASSATNSRMNSLRTGSTTGQLSSAGIYLGKYFDVQSAIGNLALAQQDPTQRPYLQRFGVSNFTRSPTENLLDMIPSLIGAWRRGPLYYHAVHGGDFIGDADINTLANEDPKKIADQIRKTRANEGALNISDRTLRGYQSTVEQFDNAGAQLKKIMIDTLSGLNQPLSDLSRSIVSAAKTLAADPDLPGAIRTLGSSIKEAAGYLASPQFKADVQSFLQTMHNLAHPFDWATKHDFTASAAQMDDPNAGPTLSEFGTAIGMTLGDLTDALGRKGILAHPVEGMRAWIAANQRNAADRQIAQEYARDQHAELARNPFYRGVPPWSINPNSTNVNITVSKPPGSDPFDITHAIGLPGR